MRGGDGGGQQQGAARGREMVGSRESREGGGFTLSSSVAPRGGQAVADPSRVPARPRQSHSCPGGSSGGGGRSAVGPFSPTLRPSSHAMHAWSSRSICAQRRRESHDAAAQAASWGLRVDAAAGDPATGSACGPMLA
jgi:hypothetical protein